MIHKKSWWYGELTQSLLSLGSGNVQGWELLKTCPLIDMFIIFIIIVIVIVIIITIIIIIVITIFIVIIFVIVFIVIIIDSNPFPI